MIDILKTISKIMVFVCAYFATLIIGVAIYQIIDSLRPPFEKIIIVSNIPETIPIID